MLVLSDVCHTLIELNSTYDYINYLHNHNYGNKKIGIILNNYLFKIVFYIYYKLTGYDYYRQITPKFFKNINKEDIEQINKDFRTFYISKRTKILDKIIEHKKSGDDVFLVSASINPPIEMLGKYLGINYFSSELEEKKGIYTGKMIKDLLGKKEDVLNGKMINVKPYKKVVFYTDDLTDIGFIKALQNKSYQSKFYIIIKKNLLKNKWNKLLSSNKIKEYEFIY